MILKLVLSKAAANSSSTMATRLSRNLTSSASNRITHTSSTRAAVGAGGPGLYFQKSKRPGRTESVYLMVLVGIASSALMYIIRLRNEKEQTELNYATQMGLMERVKKRLNAGEHVDLDHELLLDNTLATDDVTEILRSLQETDGKWRQARTVLDLQRQQGKENVDKPGTDTSEASRLSGEQKNPQPSSRFF